MKAYLQTMIATLLARGMSQREIARRTGVDRKTIRSYAAVYAAAAAVGANSPGVATGSETPAPQIPPPWPPVPIRRQAPRQRRRSRHLAPRRRANRTGCGSRRNSNSAATR